MHNGQIQYDAGRRVPAGGMYGCRCEIRFRVDPDRCHSAPCISELVTDRLVDAGGVFLAHSAYRTMFQCGEVQYVSPLSRLLC